MTSEITQKTDMQCVVQSTMPRSGTWYTFFLWENLDMLLTGREDYRLTDVRHYYHSFGVAKMHLHCTFPNFLDLAEPHAVEQYRSLDFHTGSYDATDEPGVHFTFKRNAKLRVLYIHRNPLDQVVSYYDHSRKHIDPALKIPPKKHDSSRPYESASDFAMRGGAESYLKQYLTFKYFADLGFQQLMMVSYEALKSRPVDAFDAMLEFCGARLHPEARRYHLEKAVALSSTDRVADLERQRGRAIADDQVGDNQSHMRGGETGKWQERLSPEAVDYVWSLFAGYGVHPSDFQLA